MGKVRGRVEKGKLRRGEEKRNNIAQGKENEQTPGCQ